MMRWQIVIWIGYVLVSYFQINLTFNKANDIPLNLLIFPTVRFKVNTA